jgi:glycosyltransferase involved in cell wall biosynthesis
VIILADDVGNADLDYGGGYVRNSQDKDGVSRSEERAVQQNMTESPELKNAVANRPGQDGWRIAWCHTGDSGGSKRAAFEMVRELSARGHVIDEFILRIGEPHENHWPLKEFVQAQRRVAVALPHNRLRPYALSAWVGLAQKRLTLDAFVGRLRATAEDIERGDYDFVHIDHVSPSGIVPLSAMLRKPSVVYSHEVVGIRSRWSGLASRGETVSWPRRCYGRLCAAAEQTYSRLNDRRDTMGLQAASLVLTNSFYSKEAMFQHHFTESRVCRYGVSITTFHPLGLPVEPMLLSPGRIVEAKQHHAVILAAGELPAARRPRVVVATPETESGQQSPAYCDHLVGLAKRLGVELQITRKPTEAELVALYCRALAVVFVPIMEPFGLVALEAMACGTPVIGVHEGGVRESVVEGVSGILVERGSPEIAAAIERLMGDPALRSSLGKSARDYVCRGWTWEATIDRYEDCVRRVLAKEQGASDRTGELVR